MLEFVLFMLAATAGAETSATERSASTPQEAAKADSGADRDQTKQEAKKPRRICRTVEVTGSRRGEQLCMTAEQWKRYEQ